ncbi:hypothetical protein BOTBODRAFT_34794 [Botryobasidium botryosum FD-172 SS1]|uniref:NadR/Ttd14 AAA domain-containing protein n=1 Tax=Botryobasidium botryosum (strain FD-172 SS1) TaxID=930990 RepID=A0A067MKS8_BOTB1|nr:hypothetical protein BOTBODRAFT_34794 [Botryobasidium botryosum FD-172 SS1]
MAENNPPTLSIYLIGPSSSGKTTLCGALHHALQLQHKDVVVIQEVARTVMSTQGFTRDDVGRYEMQEAIMHAQLHAERAARSQNPNSILISDRSSIDPIVYARLFAVTSLSTCHEDADRRLNALMRHEDFLGVLPTYRSSLVILFRPVKEWVVDDGVRSMENHWPVYAEFKKVLYELGMPHREIGDEVRDLDARVTLVLKWAKIPGSSKL